MPTFGRVLLAGMLLTASCCGVTRAQGGERLAGVGLDSDGDGLSDALEQRLLEQFSPKFQIGRAECSDAPAEFWRGLPEPKVQAENGTIYGQVFPAPGGSATEPRIEVHFYHLWRTDCGPHGHPLDTEHVSVLLKGSGGDPETATWKAMYWYAAAHEDTVCDVSQIARASTLGAEEHGAKVWISPGKHASYLNETLCRRGCGADRCESMKPLTPAAVINLGEPNRPMNASAFVASPAWPLQHKMQESNFPAGAVSRLEQLADTDIAWFRPGRHPVQGVIAVSGATEGSMADSVQATGSALATGKRSTGVAISVGGGSTGGALGKSYRHTRRALRRSVQHVGQALGVKPDAEKPAGEMPE